MINSQIFLEVFYVILVNGISKNNVCGYLINS